MIFRKFGRRMENAGSHFGLLFKTLILIVSSWSFGVTASAQSNACVTGVGNWSYRQANPYLQRTPPTPELQAQGVLSWATLKYEDNPDNKFARCDHASHNKKIVPGIISVGEGLFVEGEICSNNSTLIFEISPNRHLDISILKNGRVGSRDHNLAVNAYAGWYYPYAIGAPRPTWNYYMQRIILYSSYLSDVCDRVPDEVVAQVRTNISHGPMGISQKPTRPYTFDIAFSGSFHPSSGRIELIPDDIEIREHVFNGLEVRWQNRAKELREFRDRLQMGFGFVALITAGIHDSSPCNQFPPGNINRPAHCDY